MLIPIAVLVLGTEYGCAVTETVTTASLATTSADASSSPASETVPLRFQSEGARYETGIQLRPGEYLTVTLPAATNTFTLDIQADCCNSYEVSGIGAEGRSTSLLSIPALDDLPGLRSRTAEVDANFPVEILRVAPVEGNGVYAVSAIRVTTNHTLSAAVLVFFAWGLFLSLVTVARFAPRAGGRRLLDAWGRADAVVTVVVIPTLVFRLTPANLALLATMAAVALSVVACRTAFRRLSYPVLVYNGLIILLGVLAAPRVIIAVIESSIFAEYERTVDHRLNPDGVDVNADSIRFRGTSESIDTDDFNIAFLGDSFTFGYDLDYDDALPYVVERQLASLQCDRRVRAINFGWNSSSPLLALRLMRDAAHKYHPDLVIYMLDVTDFHDDLRYAGELLLVEAPRIQVSDLMSEVIERAARLVFERDEIEQILENMRTGPGLVLPRVPADRYYVTNRPLDESVEDIERGVMKNLQLIYDHATNELGASMLLVMLPRAYQYSDRESPDNWEARHYAALGPHVLAPFRYFERKKHDLPYPVLSLLPAFQNATGFPLYFRDDPHWTRAGTRVAARALADYLVTEAVVPCTG